MAGRVAVVTGGSGGIGSAICEALAAEGAHVAVTYFSNRAGAERAVARILESGGTASIHHVDVRDERAVARLFADVAGSAGPVDCLVHCAGVAYFSSLELTNSSKWRNVLDTNLVGGLLCAREALKHFNQRQFGDIVYISSLAASTGSFEGSAYAASKAGIEVLAQSLALELAPLNVRVNAVAPGRVATRFRRATAGAYYDFMIDQTPQRRMGKPSEIANAVVFVASRACEFMTGETIYVTGGLHTVYLKHVEPDRSGELGQGP